MFAVIQTGGKQYRVSKDDKLVVEKLAGDVGSVIQDPRTEIRSPLKVAAIYPV